MPKTKAVRPPARRPTPAPPPQGSRARWGRKEWLLAAALMTATLVVYSPLAQCGFVNYDDHEYVYQNSHVLAGLTSSGFRWAWTTFRAANWHPLTWLSLQLDAQLFGKQAWGYHLTNLLLHLANTLLLFALLRRLTGAAWRSALVAVLFAVHPLHVESVAWVAERKDVLSTFFGLLAVSAYARYAEAPGVGRYLLVVLGMALSLLAKPMLVTLPGLLLLLDYWPLGRWQPGGKVPAGPAGPASKAVPLSRLLVEKVPLLILAAASGAVTVWAQKEGGTVQSLTRIPLPERLANAGVSCGQYLRQTLVPVDLAIFYPHPEASLSLGLAVGAVFLVAAVTGLALWWGRRFPYLPVGWLWFLVTLLPVIGLVQVGSQARADRYTYIPLVGIFLLVVWGLADLARAWRLGRPGACLACLGLVYYGLTAWTQVNHWRNSGLLWEHSLRVTGANAFACNNLGIVFMEDQGNSRQAMPFFQAALRLDPNSAEAHTNLGLALVDQGRVEEAAAEFREAVRLDPKKFPARNALGVALMRQGKREEAVAALREAVVLDPDDAGGHYNLGVALQMGEEWADAAACYQQAVQRDPANAKYRYALAYVLHKQGRLEEAAAAGHRARDLAAAAGQPELARKIEEWLRLVEKGQPYRAGQPRGGEQ
jgi:protein O-mannosyl-transferase